MINPRNLKKFFYFALVGGFGTVLNTAILYLLSQKAGMNYLFASAIATEIAIVSNFFGNNYLHSGTRKMKGISTGNSCHSN